LTPFDSSLQKTTRRRGEQIDHEDPRPELGWKIKRETRALEEIIRLPREDRRDIVKAVGKFSKNPDKGSTQKTADNLRILDI